MMRFDVVTQSYPNEEAFFVFDEEWKQSYALGPVGPGERPAWLMNAETAAGLAGVIGVDAAGLEATISSYNESADRGLDPLFHRGSTLYSRNTGDRRNEPNPCVRALRGRLSAIQIRIASSGTSNGLTFDPSGRVLHVRGYPIPGLYVAGNVGANLVEGLWINSGTSNAKALTFGHLAVKHMLSNPSASPIANKELEFGCP
jgi:hypothetical protein